MDPTVASFISTLAPFLDVGTIIAIIFAWLMYKENGKLQSENAQMVEKFLIMLEKQIEAKNKVAVAMEKLQQEINLRWSALERLRADRRLIGDEE